MKYTTSMTVMFALAAVHAASAQSRLARPVIDTLDHHIVRVMNSGPTAWADTNGWRLVYERTIQPAEGSAGMLTKIRQIILLADGRVVVQQTDPTSILLFDATGHFARNLGREGAGPGEYHSPTLTMFHDTLIVHDAPIGRASLMRLDGTELREFVTNVHDDGPPISIDNAGRLRVESVRTSVSAFQPQWVYFDPNGHRVDSILPPVAVVPRMWQANIPGGRMQVIVPFTPQNAYAFFPDGSILYGGQDREQFFVTRNARDTARIFGRSNLHADPIPSHLRDSIIGAYASRPQMRGIFDASDVPRTYLLWNELQIDGRGNVWVSRGSTRAGTLRFDVFDPRGRYLGAVAPVFNTFWRTSWTDDRVAFVDADANDLPRIRIFRIDHHGH